ncbi:MAG: DUF1232 domain-containing protein [bacterium]|nr:DUF1232 domain-containing protein [bacterium]
MNIIRKIKQQSKLLKNEILALHYAYKDPKTKILPKIIIAIAIGYALSPIDLIPDFIPVLGYLDDLLIVSLLITLSIKLIPADIMEESRRKAADTPIKLKKNWICGILIISTWILFLILLGIKIWPNYTIHNH